MSAEDRERWDARYAAGEYSERTHPCALLEEWADELKPGRALDIACGAGRNSLYLAGRGFDVDGVDISANALQRAAQSAAAANVSVNWIQADLDHDQLPDGPYDLMVVTRFLLHSAIPQMLDRLAPGGWVVYEQHLRTDDPNVGGPKSARFRLRPQELRHLFAELDLKYYREGFINDPGGRWMSLAQLVARAPA